MKKIWLKILNLSKKIGLQKSSFLRIFSLDMEKAFLKNSPQTFSPKARKTSTHSPENCIGRKKNFVKPFIFRKNFSLTRKMLLWEPSRTFFAKSQHIFGQCLTIFIKKFHLWKKDFYLKTSVGTRKMLFQQLGKKFFAKSLIGFGSKYENEPQKKYFFETIQFLQRKFSRTRRKLF